jgi:transcriptional regulator with XRE-family HTH domain
MATIEGTRFPAWGVALDARTRAEMTIETLAQISGLSVERITAIELADVSPTADELSLIVTSCGLELRMTAHSPDLQRTAHKAAAAARTPTERIEANSAGVAAMRVFRDAGKTGPLTRHG